ncbi:MAG: serine hydrolase domain-containing protein [Acidobacteriota bacterium]
MKSGCAWAVMMMWFVLPASAAEEAGQTTMPDTVAGRRAAAYFAAFNSGDEEAMRAFLTENIADDALRARPIDLRLKTYAELRGEAGALTPVKVLRSPEPILLVLVKTAKGEWLEYSFDLDPAPPHKLRSIRAQDSDESVANEPQTPITQAEMLEMLRRYFDDATKADAFSGTVLIAKEGKPLFAEAYGLASKEYGVPNRLDTRFNLGSINKRFTKIAIWQLLEKGALSLDDPIGKFLPEYPNKEAAQKVTIRHLVDMTSGIGDFFGPKYAETPKNRLRAIADYLPLFASNPLQFEPGSQNRYSNGGYVVLGAIVEKVSRKSYYDYVREHIFKPAGMESSDSFDADVPTPNVASGYTRGWDGEEHPSEPRRNNIYTRPAKGSSAGGGYSTAEDLQKFTTAFVECKLLSPAYTEYLSTGRQPAEGGTSFDRALTGFLIAGGAPGINSVLEWDPRSGYTIVVMSNYDPPTAEDVRRRIRRWLDRVQE